MEEVWTLDICVARAGAAARVAPRGPRGALHRKGAQPQGRAAHPGMSHPSSSRNHCPVSICGRHSSSRNHRPVSICLLHSSWHHIYSAVREGPWAVKFREQAGRKRVPMQAVCVRCTAMVLSTGLLTSLTLSRAEVCSVIAVQTYRPGVHGRGDAGVTGGRPPCGCARWGMPHHSRGNAGGDQPH